MPVIAVQQTALIGWGRIVKRIFDLVGGGLLLVVSFTVSDRDCRHGTA